MHVEIVTIGDELMLGFTIDTNAAHIARALAALGVLVTRRTTVGDDDGAIHDAVRDALRRADGVITTGGLGPTSDDRSKPAVARVFGRPIELHEPTLAALRARWAARGLGELPATNRNQALVPAGATLLHNAHGSAPGIWLERADGRWAAMLPGVPREMRGMLADELLPRLRARVATTADADHVVAARVLRTAGLPESRIADMVGALVLPDDVTLAYLPGWEGVDLRVTVRGVNRRTADERLAEAVRVLRAPLGDAVFADAESDLAAVVVESLRAAGATVAVAESCTGGMLGMRLTSVPGSSSVFAGGVIAYDNAVKRALLSVRAETLDAHGAVSVEVASEMAAGVRAALGTTYGVGITGIAGPGGGVPGKPVGTVCIAVDGGAGMGSVAQYAGDREEIRLRATQAALVMLRRSVGGRTRTSGDPAP